MGPSAEGLLHHKGAFVHISPTKLVISSIRAKKIMKKFGGYSKKHLPLQRQNIVLATPLSAGSKT